ncbi:MAG: hypothetical protein ACXQS8_08190 [Candidatus Helarchaeales archaeon]
MRFCEACGAIMMGNTCLYCHNTNVVMNKETLINPEGIITSRSFFQPTREILARLESLQDLAIKEIRVNKGEKVEGSIRASSFNSNFSPTIKNLASVVEPNRDRLTLREIEEILMERNPTLKKRAFWEQSLNSSRGVIKDIREITRAERDQVESEIKKKEKIEKKTKIFEI